MPVLSFAETKGVCFLAYDAEKGQQYKFPDGLIWKIIDSYSDWISGYKSILIQPESKEKEVTVLAFAGTTAWSPGDLKTDLDQALGEVPPQYLIALTTAVKHQKEYGSLFLAGHSLGGGLAAFSSFATKVPANTINPAPLMGKVSEKGAKSSSQVTNFIAGDWEIVSSLPGRLVGKIVHVSGKGNCLERHGLANVAPELGFPKLVGGVLDVMDQMIEVAKQ